MSKIKDYARLHARLAETKEALDFLRLSTPSGEARKRLTEANILLFKVGEIINTPEVKQECSAS